MDRHVDSVAHLRSRVRSLSPQNTLDRGYAVVQNSDGSVVHDAQSLAPDSTVTVRVASGGFDASVTTIKRDDPRDQAD